MNARGHNERSFRLDALAADAREGLAKVEQGEEFTIAGWLAYGLALNEGRALFPGDREFGEWVRNANLAERNGEEIHPHDRAAAMWASANADQFEEARQRGNPRTIRGIHAKWKEIEAERAEEERQKAEAKSRADQEAAQQENKGDVGNTDTTDTTKSKPDQEQTQTYAEGQAEAFEDGTGGGGDHSPAPVQGSEPENEKEPKHILKLRRQFRSLTPEAQEDDWVGVHLDLKDEKAAHRETKRKLKEVKSKLADFTADEKNEVIRRLQSELANAGNAKWKALEDRDAYHNQVHALKKRVAELEGMGVAY